MKIPEAPELRFSADYLNGVAKGKRVVAIATTGQGRYRTNPPQGMLRTIEMLPLRVLGINTCGKFMWWSLEKTTAMFVTYGMSGMWIPGASATQHSNFMLELEDDRGKSSVLAFDDPRHFGTIKFVHEPGDVVKKLKTLGPDPFDDAFDVDTLKPLVMDRKSGTDRPICEVMMDQRVFCGVGNYVRAEAMWRARIDPRTPVKELSDDSWRALVGAARDVIRESYASHGTTLRTYKTAQGEKGKFTLSMFGRAKDTEGNVVERYEDSNGRTVHWAPARQTVR